jgi:hypothetical protein
MSTTDAVVNAWLARKRGVGCTPEEAARLCRGDRIWYVNPRTHTYEIAVVKHIGPLTPLPGGGSEPASITIELENGHERNTTLGNLRPRRLAEQ